MLMYAPVGGTKPIPVVLHKGQWYELRYDRQALSPYLGDSLPEVHTFDEFAEELKAEDPHSLDGEPEEDPTVSIQIQNSPVDTQDTSKNPSHHIVSIHLDGGAELEIATEQPDSMNTPQMQQPPIEQTGIDMSATTTTATATTTATMAPNPAPAPPDPGVVTQRIGAALNIARRRQAQPRGGGGAGNPGTPGGGGPPNPPGGGGPAGPPGGAGPPPVPAPQVGPAGVGDFWLMGTPPQVFKGDRSHAKDFLEDFNAYV